MVRIELSIVLVILLWPVASAVAADLAKVSGTIQ